jgi:hypothetical protein
MIETVKKYKETNAIPEDNVLLIKREPSRRAKKSSIEPKGGPESPGLERATTKKLPSQTQSILHRRFDDLIIFS